MKKFSDFLPSIRPYVQGASDFTIIEQVKQASREFFAYTGAWRFVIDPIATVASEAVYDLYNDYGAEVDRFEILYCDGRKVDYEVVSNMPEGWLDQTPGTPIKYLMFNPEQIMLYPAPSAVYSITGVAYLVPVDQMEDWAFEKYKEVISYGAKSRLFAIPDKPWSNVKLAMANKTLFDDEKEKAKSKKYVGSSKSVSFSW